MKKLILFPALVCFILNMNAQIRFGVKAGGNFSNLYTSGSNEGMNADQYKGRFSYHFGAVMEYSLTDMFSIQSELMYLNHGANLEDNNSFLMKNAHITLNTLQLPVNLKATFNTKWNTKLFVYGGPYAAYNIYGKVKGKIEGKSIDRELFPKGSHMKRFDYGMGVGVGAELNKFTLTLGNQIGIQDISKSEKGKMRAGNLSLSLGYFF